jgi:TonB family protein
MGLDRAALEAVQNWRFKPATLQGRPVKVYYTLTVNFQVQ